MAERILYVGPDLIFNFLKKHENEPNAYHIIVKAGPVKFTGVASFEVLDTNPPTKAECGMKLGLGSVAGPLASPEDLGKALNCLTVNSKHAGEVCCQAFLNDFLDAEF